MDSPSLRLRKPSDWIEDWWTKRSVPLSSGVMNTNSKPYSLSRIPSLSRVCCVHCAPYWPLILINIQGVVTVVHFRINFTLHPFTLIILSFCTFDFYFLHFRGQFLGIEARIYKTVPAPIFFNPRSLPQAPKNPKKFAPIRAGQGGANCHPYFRGCLVTFSLFCFLCLFLCLFSFV